jgi:hypothetical protein
MTTLESLFIVLVLVGVISAVLLVAGLIADWLWPWVERFGRCERRQAVYRTSK